MNRGDRFNKDISGTLNYILFLVWPFAALFFALANYKSTVSKNIVWFFCAFFGFTFVISSEGIDAAFYRDKFIYAYNDPSIEFMSYVLNEGSTDFFINFLNFTLSRFTDDYRILFLTFGFLFGFFYSRNIFLLLNFTSLPLKRYAWLPLLLFVFLIPFWNINGIRFYLATHIFVYSTAHFFLFQRKKYLLIALFAPLVHFSFVLCLSVLLVYLLLGKRLWIYLVFLTVAMFIYQPSLGTILSNLPQVSGAAQDKLEGYTYLEYIEDQKAAVANASWFLYLRSDLLSYLFYIVTAYFILFRYRELRYSRYAPFLIMGVLFLSLGKFTAALPNTGRFISVGFLFFAAFLYFKIMEKKMGYWLKRIMIIAIFPMLLFIIVEIRVGINVISPGIFYTNPLVAPYIEYNTPLSYFYE